MSKRTKEDRLRQAWARRGERIRLGAPTHTHRFAVRYLRADGKVITRPFAVEAYALRFADRLKRYGKTDVEVWMNTARPRWTQLQ